MNASREKRNHAAWIGPLVALIGLVTYFTVAVRFPALRDSASVNLTLAALGVGAAFGGLMRHRNWKSWLGASVATVAAALLVGYVFVLSNQLPSPDTAPVVGAVAPPLELPDQTGRMLALDDLLGDRVLVVFYRGYW